MNVAASLVVNFKSKGLSKPLELSINYAFKY